MKQQGLQTGVKVALTLALSLALGMSAGLVAQEEMHEHESSDATGESGGAMMERCQAMSAKHNEMGAQMDAMYEKLTGLRTEMDEAQGEAKTIALAAIVSEMVEQHQAMGAMMMQAQPRMMKHMMEHMSSGMGEGGMKSMEGCPMMKKMSGSGEADDEASAEHTEHHPEG